MDITALSDASRHARIPPTVLALGAVSLLMDISSELIHSLLPMLLVTTLGVGAALFGIIEGIAEAAVMVTKVVSGACSDRIRRRKPLLIAGYGLAMLVKPLFPLAGSAMTVFLARVLDRIGKGVRGAPRDALVADVTPLAVRGAAYGLRQALDSVGALLGPLLAFVLMGALDGDLRATLWWAVPPALLACVVLMVFVREPARPVAASTDTPRPRIDWHALGALGRAYWAVVGVGVIFTLARFSEGFLLLRAADVGIAVRDVPLALAGMSAVYAASAYPAGRLSDRLPRRAVLALGALVLALADIVLALADDTALLASGIALWGLHLGFTQGVLSALVADAAPAALRGTGFGVFGIATGVAMLAASVLAGGLWQFIGPAATFWAAAGIAAVAMAWAMLGLRFDGGR